MKEKTKIVCTIGPKSHNEQTIFKMAKAGMNIVRMNFSHGYQSFHTETIRMTKKVSIELDIYRWPRVELSKTRLEEP